MCDLPITNCGLTDQFQLVLKMQQDSVRKDRQALCRPHLLYVRKLVLAGCWLIKRPGVKLVDQSPPENIGVIIFDLQ